MQETTTGEVHLDAAVEALSGLPRRVLTGSMARKLPWLESGEKVWGFGV